MSALQGIISPSEVNLRCDDPDTMILMAELSFYTVSKWREVAEYLSLNDYDIDNLEESYINSNSTLLQQEAAFQMMLTWITTSTGDLQCLIDAFKTIVGVMIRTQKLDQTMYVRNHEDRRYDLLSRGTVNELSKRIASRRKIIGRLLGMTESRINSAVFQGGSGLDGVNKVIEETIAILDWWGKTNGYGATLFKLENAIYSVHYHSAHKLKGIIHFLDTSF